MKVNLVADCLNKAGFDTRIEKNRILTYLSRKITRQEIEIVLAQEFGEIEFKIELGAGNNFAVVTV